MDDTQTISGCVIHILYITKIKYDIDESTKTKFDFDNCSLNVLTV